VITLLLLAQITREEFLDFKRQTEVQFAEIRGEINELKTEVRAQIQALNQRIDSTNKRIDDFISFMRILSSVLIAITAINLALVINLYYKERKS
jgi:anti-sigma-K factor RskA